MARSLAPLLLALGFGLGLWLALPALSGALGLEGLAAPAARAALAVGLAALLALAGETWLRGRAEVALRAELAELRRSVRDAEEEVLWARRELKSLVDGLRAHREAQAPERALNEARAEVKLLQSVVTRLDGAQGRAAGAAVPVSASAGVTQIDPRTALAAVREALKQDRIELVLQPIVSLPQRRRRFFECFSRLRDADGRLLLPEAYIPVAERAGLMSAIDNMLLLRCIQLVRRIQKRGERLGFVCNLSPHTLQDPDFFGDFVDYLDANAELASSLVFEMAQADFAALAPEAEAYLSRLWHLGARLSVDSMQDLAFDPTKLTAKHVDLVKIPARALLGRPGEEVARLRARLAQAEIDLVVEKIESDEQLVELLELGIDFGQGYLFGEPRPAKLAA